jgi:ATP phosphoribosyltransferase
MEDKLLKLALPSDGELHEPTLRFLGGCGMPVERASARRYTARLGAVPGCVVLFQRAADITSKVEEGSADLGIMGLDRFMESRREGGDALLIVEDLRYGRCELVLAVPDVWVDVTSTVDLADLAVAFREKGRDLRIATKFPRLVQRFLYAKGINYFTLAESSGSLEVAPAMGFADIIADISSTGVTLRENHLKTLADGTILSSQACLIGNRRLLAQQASRLEVAREVLERLEAHLSAQDSCAITANVRGESPEAVATYVMRRRELAGIQGPTVAPVYGGEGGWYAVTVVVPRDAVLEAVEHFRRMGGNGITVAQPTYLFQPACSAYERLLAALRKE